MKGKKNQPSPEAFHYLLYKGMEMKDLKEKKESEKTRKEK